jgi:tetratricopeptide (TPR) repeat protein
MADETQDDEQNIQANDNSIAFGSIHIEGSVYGDVHIGNTDAPTQKALPSLHQLPQPPADFTGGQELITKLLVDIEHHKAIMLTGMGGIGKTTLGLYIAKQILNDYIDAQIYLDLQGTTRTPLKTMDIMCHVIQFLKPDMDLRALDETGMANVYHTVLHDKQVLLFLDNARSADQIEPLKPPDRCALLVTSRWIFDVPGLSIHRLDIMSEENAKAFLLKVSPRIGEHTDELARECAYLPLALRIAGSFLKVNDTWAVKEYLDRLKDHRKRLPTLDDSRAQVDLSKDHPYLQATFELSYNQLSEEAQKHWRMLAVFSGTFDAMAAQAIWELEKDTARRQLSLLRRYSLLDYDETSARYSLHDLLAEYARSQMHSEEDYEAHLKHAFHYKHVLSAADDLYLEGGEKILSGLLLFDIEWENIRMGHDWTVTTKGKDETLAKLCMEYPDAGVYVLSLRQHPTEKIHWLDAAVSSAREIGDRRGEGNALGNLGNAYHLLGETHKAIEFYEQIIVIHRENGDRRGEGRDLGNLGNAYAALGETRKAIQFHEQALLIDRETGDRRGEGAVLSNLGLAYAALGETHKAIEYYEQDLIIARETGDRRGEGAVLSNLGNAYAALSETRKAIEYYEQALMIDCENGDRRGEGADLFNMGLAFHNLEEKARASELVRQALAIYEAIESPYAEVARNALKAWGALPEDEDMEGS